MHAKAAPRQLLLAPASPHVFATAPVPPCETVACLSPLQAVACFPSFAESV